MKVVRFHPHAIERLLERGASQQEVIDTLSEGERFQAKHGRTGFRRNFVLDGEWQGRVYANKQVEAYAVEEEDGWLVIAVIVKFF